MEMLGLFQTVLDTDQIKIQEAMAKHTTFRVGGPAEVLITPRMDQLAAVLQLCREHCLPVLVIGNGSNMLVSDEGISGVVIEIGRSMSEITVNGSRITAQAGALLSKVAAAATEHCLTGIEFASGIPGSIGGALFMNAGAYGGEMKDVVVSARVMTSEGEICDLSLEELDLSYRHSVVSEKGYIVLDVTLGLENGDPAEIQNRIDELTEKRTTKQPLEFPSAGSTFKRPEGYFAGKLIQDSGLRGHSCGGAQVSEKHCGFVINKENATASDVYRLIKEVQAVVKEKFGVSLETEVKMIGKF